MGQGSGVDSGSQSGDDQLLDRRTRQHLDEDPPGRLAQKVAALAPLGVTTSLYYFIANARMASTTAEAAMAAADWQAVLVDDQEFLMYCSNICIGPKNLDGTK